jgi:DNA-binding transcriptional LysR family regulator
MSVTVARLIHKINSSKLIYSMKKFDHLDLDGHLLKLLGTVIEAGSVTRAAQTLGLTQSAVSHQLDRLRAIVGDALFVKSGRGIVPTARAQALANEAQSLLEKLQGFVHSGAFDPSRLNTCLTIAANDLQRDLILPRLLNRLRQDAPQVSLSVVASDVPSAQMLRDEACQLVISPRPPDATDIKHKRLFSDQYRVFYDPACRKPPRSRQQYLAAEHVTVVHQPKRSLDIDEWLLKQGTQRRFAATVSNFAGVAAFVSGTTRLATLPGLLRQGQLRGLADAPTPVTTPAMPMFAIWHLRHQNDPMHAWLRDCLWQCVEANP